MNVPAQTPRTALSPAIASTRDTLGLAAAIASGLVVLALSWTKLGSIDLGYHLAYGRHFLSTGHIVEVDPFLYPENAKRFVNANWGSQVIMALVEKVAGATGLFALCLGLIAVIFGAMAWTVLRKTKSALALALAWLLGAFAGYERFSLRPELFSYACMMLVLLVLADGLRSWRGIVAIGVIQLAWVNLHSYFLVGPILTGCWLIGAALRDWWFRNRPAELLENGRLVRLLLIAFIVQIAACFVNPRTYEGAVFPIKTLEYLRQGQVMGGGQGWSGESAWSMISEFKSPFSFLSEPINARTIHAYLVLLAFAALGVAALLKQGRLGAALAVVILFAMSTQMRRNIAQFALVATPLTVIAWSDAISNLRHSAYQLLRNVAAIAAIGLSLWWTFGIIEGRFYYDERRITRQFGTGYCERVFPIDAAAWLTAQPSLHSNLYVNYFASSSALPWLPERFKLFVDTNTFAYEEGTLATAYKLGMSEIDYQPVFQEHHVNIALLHCGSDTQMLIRKLAMDTANWALVYFDRHVVIFVRRIPEHASLIASNQRTEKDLAVNRWIMSIPERSSQFALELGLSAGVPLSLGWHCAAIELSQKAVQVAPDYYEGWQYLGVSHGNLGNIAGREGRYDDSQREYTEALKCFERVLELRPDHTDAKTYRERTRAALEFLKGR
jgi:tetratricopeptide (TPR) repeat protein